MTRDEKQARAIKATAMRLAGARYDDIAQALGYNSRQAVHDAVQRMLRDLPAENPEHIKNMEMARLDRLQQGLWPLALNGNQGAIDRILRIMERRAKLLGIDAPTQTQVAQISEVQVVFADDAPLATPDAVAAPDHP